MRILFTGASSATGSRVLERILASIDDVQVWCIRHQRNVPVTDHRVHSIDLDLASDFAAEALPDAIDLVIHFAGVTHAIDPQSYWKVNFQGTQRLAEAVHARGSRRFVYISTRCANAGAGAYGESKLAAENELNQFPWDSLLIVRPSEIYGAAGNEGLDKLMTQARRWHVTPVLFGQPNISFAPIHIEDFATIVADEILKQEDGVKTIEVCGPEDLTGAALAGRISRRFRALPIPVWWPLLAIFIKITAKIGMNVAAPDQLQRLTCVKTSYARNAQDWNRAISNRPAITSARI